MAHPLQFRKWFGALLVVNKAENPVYFLERHHANTSESSP